MENFTPIASLIGGMLIGLSAATVLYFQGRIAGISGIVGGLLRPRQSDTGWRATFVLAMLLCGVVSAAMLPSAFEMRLERSVGALVFAGLLVGFGTRLAGGCTSGHGVCGLSRISKRSLVATLTFMTLGALTAFGVSRFLGGAL